MSDHIIATRDGAIMRLKFNRPDKKNAITAGMYGALADGMLEAEGDDALRVILFEAEGDCFTSGNDIADFLSGGGSPEADGETPHVMRFLQGLATAQKPMVAAVNGASVGVGVTMLLHCDLVYASPLATFKTPFVDLGLVPEAASSMLMPALAGHQRAAEMILAGKKIDGARAVEFGFVNEVVQADELITRAMAEAQSLAEKAPEALRLTKMLMKGDRAPVLDRMQKESEHFAAQLQSAEFREAGMAFMQKRKPNFG